MKTKKLKHKQLTIITIIFSIISLVFLSTIAYSAFSSTMNITGLAHARVEANVRITDFKLESSSNAISSYEDFGKNHITTAIDFKENSSVTYKVEVTNYGTTEVGIYNITGLPENVSYELIDYNLKDKLCDTSNKCNSFITKTFYIKFSSSNIKTDLNINFDFRVIHNISYVNLTGNYQKTVYDQETISINLQQDSPKYIIVDSNEDIIYNYQNNILVLNKVSSNLVVEAVNDITKNYEYTGNEQTFIAPTDGVYKIELWGASGGYAYDENLYKGGAGSYTSGMIELSKSTKLFVIVGRGNQLANNNSQYNYFGGGAGGEEPTEASCYGGDGGGSTDIRITDSINSRIMVAAGGGGAGYQTDFGYGNGGAGGGLTSNDSIGYQTAAQFVSTGATQTSAGSTIITERAVECSGKFGYGGHACYGLGSWYYTGTNFTGGGGGGGYYGGGGASDSVGGAGGTSYISGHNGCVAIASSISTDPRVDSNKSQCKNGTTDKVCSYHYSGYKFTNTKMIDGEGYIWTTTKGTEVIGMPTHDGTSTMIGNTGNGYAKITLVQVKDQYSITYTNINGTYQSTIYKGNDLVVDFKSNALTLVKVLENGKEKDYTYKNGVITIKNVTGNIEIKAIKELYEYDYTGNYQTFTAPYDGIYKVELWGAQGNDDATPSAAGALGGYTKGTLKLNKGQKIYVYVGSKGNSIGDGTTFNNGTGTAMGWNGGGSTDIRLTADTWYMEASIRSRIMVAAGGGIKAEDGIAGAAGGLVGYDGGGTTGGTQTGFGPSNYTTSFFGIAMGGCTGGNGYYPASGAACASGSGGGSSFISGHNGCVAISSSASTTPKTGCANGTTDITCSYHYSGYIFNDTIMVDGEGYNWTTEKGIYTGMPTHDGTSTMKGNSGNGFAKISLIELLQNYEINYYGIEGSYPNSVEKGQNITINFGNNAPDKLIVLENNIEHSNYTYQNKILTINSVQGNLIVSTLPYTNNFNYTNNIQEYTIPVTGTYQLETWGAQGGVIDSVRFGGYGGYSKGTINLTKGTKLYIAVGGSGKAIQGLQAEIAGGYNGGGNAITSFNTALCQASSGGGATHISYKLGLLKKLENNLSDIIIVSGAGGGYYYDPAALAWGTETVGHGGGFKGTKATDRVNSATPNVEALGATQTTGYAFGQGTECSLGKECAGGGGGLYGGIRSHYTGSGGSGYIGHQSLTNKHMTCYQCETSDETSTKTISTTNVSETPISDYAKIGNGYAKITLIEKN